MTKQLQTNLVLTLKNTKESIAIVSYTIAFTLFTLHTHTTAKSHNFTRENTIASLSLYHLQKYPRQSRKLHASQKKSRQQKKKDQLTVVALKKIETGIKRTLAKKPC